MDGKSVTLKQVRSVIRCTQRQRSTMLGLGLKGIGSTSTLISTPAVAGMIRKVSHLIKVVE